MKIKANQNLYKNVLIMFAGLSIFIESLAYFLGFNINTESLSFYFLFIAFTAIISFVLFLLINRINNKYIIFDKEKIIEKSKHSEKIIVYYSQIKNIKYQNRIDLIRGIVDFGYAEIMYNQDPRESQYMILYMSQKDYDRLWMILRNGLQ